MRLKKRSGEKFVLMLGAGASLSSGVKFTSDIMKELVENFGQDLPATDRIEDRFDRVWQRTPDATRRAFLQPYLDHTPSLGYSKLAALVEAGYFDVILTFNFDDLVEASFNAIGYTDFGRIIRGETKDEEMQTLVDSAAPRSKIVKLHGSLASADHFLFDINEMNEYPKPIADLVTKVTARDLVVCGYGFADLCLLRAFSTRGGSVVCVNPSGVPRGLRGFLKDRRSDDLAIDAKFDEFFDELHAELLEAPPPPATNGKGNPFKFLESYEAADKDAFTGRTDEIARFQAALATKPQVIIVAGPAKAGKTSLVRAGLIPAIDGGARRSLRSLSARAGKDPPRRAMARPPERFDAGVDRRLLATRRRGVGQAGRVVSRSVRALHDALRSRDARRTRRPRGPVQASALGAGGGHARSRDHRR